MGGNALSFKTKRFNLEEYEEVKSDVLHILQEKIKCEYYVPLSYKNKSSFGDLDVLIKNNTINANAEVLRNTIQYHFKPKEIYPNSNVVSFDYKDFQIDFIIMKDRFYESSKVYYSYNDLGNIMGRIANRLGFQYGHYGLAYNYISDSIKKKYYIDAPIDKVFDFLGFDYQKFEEGFNTLEDIFQYVIDSKYFLTHIFDYENLNHQNRTRNKKRKNYALFLEYIKNIDDSSKLTRYIDRLEMIRLTDHTFNTGIEEFINNQIKQEIINKEAHAKFNGHHIMKLFPHLSGIRLGNAIRIFKNSVADDDQGFKNYLINNDYDDIIENFKNVIAKNDS